MAGRIPTRCATPQALRPRRPRRLPRPEDGAELTAFRADAVAALPGPPGLAARRLAALERLDALAVPDTTAEEWRYSRIGALDLDRYAPATTPSAGALPDAVEAVIAASGAATVVVVTDGLGVDVRRRADGVSVGTDDGEEGAASGGRSAGDVFGGLNDAFSLPLRIEVAAGARPGGVLVVHWLGGAAGVATFPRTHVVVGAQAEVELIELAASAAVDALTVPRTDVEVGDGAIATYLHLQQLGSQVWQIAEQASRVGRDATFSSHAVALGGDYARVRTTSSLVGTGGTTRLLAVYLGTGSRMVDFRTVQEHRAPRTTSELLFKGAVANRSRAVYSGLIRVEKGASGTNAFQTNRNLVLHEGARADSVPNLEIEDNDVRCSHASAVGPIAEDQRFYLASRGVPPEVGDRLITLGFLDEVLQRMRRPRVADHLRLELVAALESAERWQRAGASGGAVGA